MASLKNKLCLGIAVGLLMAILGWVGYKVKKSSQGTEDLARRFHVERYFIRDGLLVDDVELTQDYIAHVRDADQAAELSVREKFPDAKLGRAYLVQQEKKKYLQGRGIAWRGSIEMNPWLEID